MKNIVDLHKDHREWLSTIDFMFREIDFFKTISTKFQKEYHDDEFRKTLAAFDAEFERVLKKLRKEKILIEFSEVRLKESILIDRLEPVLMTMDDPGLQSKKVTQLFDEVRVLKESMFDLVAQMKRKQNRVEEFY